MYNRTQRTVSGCDYYGNTANFNQMAFDNAVRFYPTIKNSNIKNGGQDFSQIGEAELQLRGALGQPKKLSFNQRRLSSRTNSESSGQAYFNNQGFCADNSIYPGNGFDNCIKNQKSDWYMKNQSDAVTESSAASSNGELEQDQVEASRRSVDVTNDVDFIFMNQMKQEYCEATRGGKRKTFKNAEERFQFKQQYESKKKTELCRNFEMYGQCKFGDTCSYAHGIHQLQKKTHLPSNFMTKLCTQFHEEGACMYGERCQFLHSIYDLKTDLTYSQALREGARLTQQRNAQISKDSGAECLWANLKTGNGCGAPKGPRLACFEQIYNKDSLEENLRIMKEEDDIERQAYGQISHSPQPIPAFRRQNTLTNSEFSTFKSNSCNVQYNFQGFNQQQRMSFQKPLGGISKPFVPSQQHYSPQPVTNEYNTQTFFRQI